MVTKIIIADRSELAGNMYRLLLHSTNATLIIKNKFLDILPYFKRREGIDLLIMDSNVIGKKMLEIKKYIDEIDSLSQVKKIVIVKDSDADASIRAQFEKMDRTKIVMRPFHPDELKGIIKSYI